MLSFCALDIVDQRLHLKVPMRNNNEGASTPHGPQQ